MNPNPLSRTSRLIVPLGIRVSLGAYAQVRIINFRSTGTFDESRGFMAEQPIPSISRDENAYGCVQKWGRGPGSEARGPRLGSPGPRVRDSGSEPRPRFP